MTAVTLGSGSRSPGNQGGMGTHRKRIGYWMKPGKAKRINIELIRQILNDKHNCDLEYMDARLDHFPEVDAIFHKMSDLMFDAQRDTTDNAAAVDQLEKFQRYFKAREDLRVFDPLANVRKLLDRVLMMEAIQRCSNACHIEDKFYSCGYYQVQSWHDPDTTLANLENKNFNFPVICKSRIAQGSQGHDMSIIFNKGGLKTPETGSSTIIVPFISHNAVLYKVFVCGDKFHVVTRPSITLHKLKRQEHQVDSYNFHSDTVSKVNAQSTSQAQEDLCDSEVAEHLEPLEASQASRIAEWVTVIRKELELSLFGFDLIFEKKTNRPFIIDINYFPGYDGFENFHEILADMLYRACP